MSISSCLSRLLKEGKISQKQADDARSIFDGVLNEGLQQQMDQATAEGYAALKAAEILESTAQAKKVELARRMALYNSNIDRINAHPNGPLAGFMGLFDRDIRNAPSVDRQNVTSLEREFYQPQIAQKMHAADEAYRSKAAGLKQDVAGVRNMIGELFGVKSGDAIASKAAAGWKAATDWGTKRAENLGKVFDTAEDWRLPQFWDSARVSKFGDASFKTDLQKHIDAGGVKVFDPETGRMVGGADQARVIDQASKNIRKDLSSGVGPGSIFKDEQRVFRFQEGQRGSDAYLELMDKYGPGQGRYFAMMQNHAEKMGRELAMLHVLGPGFRSSSEQLLKDAINEDAERALQPSGKNAFEKIGDGLLKMVGLEGRTAAKRMQQYMTGQLSGVEGDTFAGVMQGARSFMTATNMGSAIVTAIPSDTVNWAMAANFRGLNMGRLTAAITDQLFKDIPDKEAFASRLGIVAHASSRAALATKQYGDQLVGSGVFQRMADFVVRAQGLHAWDQAINRAFTMEFMASIAERSGKAFGDLDAPFARFMKDYGFTEADWAKLSAGETMSAGAARFLMPDRLDDDIRAKLMSAVGDEKQFAYLAGGSNRVRALTTGGVKGGTLGGDAARSFFMFKSFPISMLATHGVRAAQEAADGQWGQAAQLGLFMTMAGAVALQAKQVLQGKDPQQMKDPFFWGEAAAQGGALGIYGDFLKEGFSRSGTSLTEAAIGPLAQIPASVQRLTSSARRAAEQGDHFNFGAALADDIQRYTPGSTIWYTRLLANRFLFDNIRKQVDPDYAGSFGRQRETAQRLHGQDFWWAPGESAPSAAPNLTSGFR
ncbi:MAG: hypothetical protein WDN46_12185 [Methylocella sp.]